MTLHVKKLRCEHKENPLGIDVKRPRLSWQMLSDNQQVVQVAYQIQVYHEQVGERILAWDTGKVMSDCSLLVEYNGEQLKPRARYIYKVKIWDNHGEESLWSEEAYWESGLLSHTNWCADWITTNPLKEQAVDPCDYFRRTFMLQGEVKSARIYASALGLYELHLNGQRVTENLFTPGWTSYKSRIQYQTYDVTHQLQAGANALGAIVGNGWYKGPLNREHRTNVYGSYRAILVQLHIAYEDGHEEVIGTDGTWTSSTGPILYSELYEGECYDARLTMDGWDIAAFNDAAWAKVSLLAYEKHMLISQENDPTRVVERLKPIELFTTPAGETVLDMGQNMVGWVRFQVAGTQGKKVTLQHAEILDGEGNFYTANLREAKQEITYICRGEGTEWFEPHFTFQGFRYVKLIHFPEDVQLDQFEGCVIHTDMAVTGEFECSDPLINQLQHNIVWGQKGNFLDVPTDCPQRNERLGWVGDAQIFIRTAGFNMNVASFFSKWVHDLKADQREDGAVPDVVPNIWDWTYTKRPSAVFPNLDRHSSSAWADAAVICPWTLYLMYSDERILAEQYDSMRGWVEFVRRTGDNEYLWNTGFHYGDWLALDAKEDSYLGATPNDLIATAFYAYSTALLAKSATVLGKEQDAAQYEQLHHHIVQAFNDEFVTPNGRLIAVTQTAHVLALMFNLVGPKDRKRVADGLAQLVREQDVHLTTGFVGTPYLCQVLSRHGYHDLACELVLQQDYPSWLYAVTRGATTIWEHWDSLKVDGTFWSTNMNSFNHYAYGSIGEWFYHIAAGLEMDEQQPGYKRIRISPKPVKQWTYARVKYDSTYGEIQAGWKRTEDGERLIVHVSIPANTTAEVRLPGCDPQTLLVNGAVATNYAEVYLTDLKDNELKLELGSGQYVFEYAYLSNLVHV